MIYKGGKKVSPSPEIHGDFCYEPEVTEDLWKTEEHSLSGDSCIYRRVSYGPIVDGPSYTKQSPSN
jgi:hypothetical protein